MGGFLLYIYSLDKIKYPSNMDLEKVFNERVLKK